MDFENLKRKKRERHQKHNKTIPGWLYLGLMVVYHEVLLHLWTTPDGDVHQLAAVSLFARVSALNEKRILVSVLLFFNGVVLYVPQFLPGSNRDSRTLSRVEGLWMGLGGALSILPGISTTGASASIGSVCGVDRVYGLNMTYLLTMVLTVGLMVHDLFALVLGGLSGLTFLALLSYILSGAAAFAGAYAAVRLLRTLVINRSFSVFAFYCWGLSLFTFILYLTI